MANPNVLIYAIRSRLSLLPSDTEFNLILDGNEAPNIRKNQAYYIWPFDWSVDRIYHIINSEIRDREDDKIWVLNIGNSFIIKCWPREYFGYKCENNSKHLTYTPTPKLFVYVPVTEFGLMEIQPGVLVPLPAEIMA